MAETLLFFGTGMGQSTIWVSDGTAGGTTAINASEVVDGYAAIGRQLITPSPILYALKSKIYTISEFHR